MHLPDGLGYHDDGEEHYNEDDDAAQFRKNKSKKSGKNAALTKDALRRARKSKEMASAGSGDGEDGDGSGGKKGGGMWDFVNKGVGSSAARKSGGGSASAATSGGASGSGSSSVRPNKVRGGGGGSNLDDLLGDLDDSYPTTASTKRRTSGASKGARRGVYGSSSARTGGVRGGASRGGRAGFGGRARYQQEQQSAEYAAQSNQYDDDDAPTPFADDDDDDDEVVGGGDNMDVEPSPTKSGEKRKVADDEDSEASPSSKKVSFEKSNADNGDDAGMEVDGNDAKASSPTASATAKAVPRRRLAKAKVGSKMSAPLRAAMEAKKAQQAAVAKVTQASAAAGLSGGVKQEVSGKSTTGATMSTTAPRSLDANSASFRPDVIEGESNQSDEMKAAAAANFESVIQTEVDNVEEGKEADRYLDFFWTDAKEHPSRKGTILLFGKVEVNAASQNAKCNPKNKNAPKQYVSCCVAVSGNSRNLFVLPRKKEGSEDEYESMMDVHTELKSVLQPACIPNREGASWGGKVVERQYAFHDASVPRDATKYLKVVYDAQYPVPAEEDCMNGGRYFQKIFGAGASNLENFIVKRKRESFVTLFGLVVIGAYCFISLTHTIPPISFSLQHYRCSHGTLLDSHQESRASLVPRLVVQARVPDR